MIPLFYVRPRNFALTPTGEPTRRCQIQDPLRRALFSSVLFHFFFFTGLIIATAPTQKARDAVSVSVVSIIPTKTLEPRPLEPKPKVKPPKEKKKVVSERNVSPKAPPAQAVQGLPPDAVQPDTTGIAAPIGNTLLTEDEGKRIRPEDYRDLGGDLSADARLIMKSVVVPKYTDAALEGNLEGNFVVDVYVDESGNVLQSEVRKRVGFGMDERLLAAAQMAKFQPRKNKFGRTEAGWAEIKFTLLIP